MYRPNPNAPSQAVNLEQGINVANVALIDPSDDRPCKSMWRLSLDSQTGALIKERVSRRTGTLIPFPELPKRERKGPGLRDTLGIEALKKTYQPNLKLYPIPRDCSI